jgi:hypothetical protein
VERVAGELHGEGCFPDAGGAVDFGELAFGDTSIMTPFFYRASSSGLGRQERLVQSWETGGDTSVLGGCGILEGLGCRYGGEAV